MTKRKVVQLIPAPKGIVAEYKTKNGIIKTPIVFIALEEVSDDQGFVCNCINAVDIDAHGCLQIVGCIDNLKRITYPGFDSLPKSDTDIILGTITRYEDEANA